MVYDVEIAVEICSLLAGSSRGLIEILNSSARYPSYETIMKWLNSNDEFSQMYAQSRQLQAEFMADEIIAISDETEGDAVLKYDRDGRPFAAFDGRNVQRAKLMTDNRRWLMSKMHAAKYGDKLDVTSDGKALPAAVNSVTIEAKVETLMLIAARRRAAAALFDDSPEEEG
jgi:hypothetical protein